MLQYYYAPLVYSTYALPTTLIHITQYTHADVLTEEIVYILHLQ